MNTPAPRLPLIFTVAALVAVAALYRSAKPSLIGPTIALLLVLPHLTSWRLRGHRIIDWTIRIIIWAAVITMMPRRVSQGASILYEPDYVHLFGWLCGFELVLRVWTRWNYGPSRVEALLLTALILTAASNTLERTGFHALAPIYAVLVALCLRQIVHRTEAGVEPPALATPWRLASVAAAVGLGFVLVQTVKRFDSTISSLAVELLRAGRESRRAEIGWATAPELRAVFNPQPSLDRVALIDGPATERHVRAIAFDRFDGARWLPTMQQRQFMPLEPSILCRPADGSRLRVRLVGNTDDILLLPLNVAAVDVELDLQTDSGASIRTAESHDDLEYELTVPTGEQFQGPLCWPPDDSTRAAYTELPDNFDPRITDLARTVARDGDSAARVLRIAQHLRSQHQYSLSYAPEGDDALADFILNRRAAHCQYFASALVLMSRAIGVPARLVTGFYAHETYGRNRMVIRGRDSHAWAECWIDGVGWVTLDATPAGGLPNRQFAQASAWRRFWERAGDLPGVIRRWLSQLPWLNLAMLGGSLGAVAVSIAMLIRWWRRRRQRREPDYSPGPAELAQLRARFQHWLARTAAPLPTNVTWREHVGPALPLCDEFLDLYDRARFGAAGAQAAVDAAWALERLEKQPRFTDGPQH